MDFESEIVTNQSFDQVVEVADDYGYQSACLRADFERDTITPVLSISDRSHTKLRQSTDVVLEDLISELHGAGYQVEAAGVANTGKITIELSPTCKIESNDNPEILGRAVNQ
jgi:hypothetical protein